MKTFLFIITWVYAFIACMLWVVSFLALMSMDSPVSKSWTFIAMWFAIWVFHILILYFLTQYGNEQEKLMEEAQSEQPCDWEDGE